MSLLDVLTHAATGAGGATISALVVRWLAERGRSERVTVVESAKTERAHDATAGDALGAVLDRLAAVERRLDEERTRADDLAEGLASCKAQHERAQAEIEELRTEVDAANARADRADKRAQKLADEMAELRRGLR